MSFTHIKSFLHLLIILFWVYGNVNIYAQKSIQDFGVLPNNSAEVNTKNLQAAIDWASKEGASLIVTPSSKPYSVNSGIILRRNTSIVGVHGPTPRGTKHSEKQAPVGSVFSIMDSQNPFLTVESATQVRGIQFWYPNQSTDDPHKIIAYPPTIQLSKTSNSQGVTLSNLTFYGEYISMDFNAVSNHPSELILIEHCYGYPLSGEFIRIDYCYDIPRILHCHVNPAIMREFNRQYSKEMVDEVIKKKSFAFKIDHTDNAQLIDIFTFGTWGGIHLGEHSYGQLTNFNLDCVAVGIHKLGAGTFNRNWMISQGSIIANTGDRIVDIHPFIIEGQGHTSITNVEAFSGDNPALSNFKKSYDFALIKGNQKLTVSIIGARMRNYESSHALTVQNQKATIQVVASIDKDENFINEVIGK